MLSGLLASSALDSVLSAFAIFSAFWAFFGDRLMDGRLRASFETQTAP